MLYAVIDPDGDLDGVAENLKDAVDAAGQLAPRVKVEGGEESHLDGYGEFGAINPADYPKKALLFSGLPRMDLDHVMRMSIEEAYSRVERFFPKTRSRKDGSTVRVGSYTSPAKLVENLLGQNYKTAKKTPEAPTKVMGLSLLPYSQGVQYSSHKLPMKGLGFCAGSNKSCQQACLVNAGHNAIDIYNRIVKIARTDALSLEPHAFTRVLVASLNRHFNPRKTPEYEPLVRLNVFSDIPWELVCPGIFEMFSGAQFYDYTKVPGRVTPPNYDLTFSWSGTNDQYAYYEIERGRRIAVVFLLPGTKHTRRTASLPSRWLGLSVVDGDVSDVRPRDPAPSIVGLRWKSHGLGKKHDIKTEEHTAFVVPVKEVDGVLVAAEASSQSPIEDHDGDEETDGDEE